MSSENYEEHRLNMSEGLKNLTNKMVSEGVTPKSGMKKVKAMKRLWRSDSFQMMKSILEEPPIQEGRVRPSTIPLKDDDDDELAETEPSPRDTALEKENREKELEFLKKKEELRLVYQNCLEDDLADLQVKTEEIVNELLKDVRIEVEKSEGGQLDEIVKHKIKEMMNFIKCFKKNRDKTLKLALEEDRKVVTEELKDYMEREMEIRAKTYKKLVEKVYNYKFQLLEDSVADEYEDRIRQKIRMSINKFEYAKDKLMKKHKKNIFNLNCKLATEFSEYVKWSGSRMNTMLEEEIKEMKEKKESEKMKAEESDCSIAERMKAKLRLKGWLPWEPSENEDWGSLIQELMNFYQILIEFVMKDMNTKQNEYLLSMEKLNVFKDKIAQINQKKLMETKDKRAKQSLHLKAKLRAASILDNLIKQVLPSPLPSRFSYSDLLLKPKCYRSQRTSIVNRQSMVRSSAMRMTITEDSKTTEIIKKELRPIDESIISDSKALHKAKTINFESLKNDMEKQSENDTETHNSFVEDRDAYVNILHENPQLYNVFFFNL